MKGIVKGKRYGIKMMTAFVLIAVLAVGSVTGCGKTKPGTDTENAEVTPEAGSQTTTSGNKPDTGNDTEVSAADEFYDTDAYTYSLKKKLLSYNGEVAYTADNIIICSKEYDYDAADEGVYPDNAITLLVDYYDYNGKPTGEGFTLMMDYDDSMYDFCADSKGNVYFIHSTSNYDDQYGYFNAYELVEYDKEGQLAQSVIFEDSSYDFTVKDILVTQSDKLMAITNEGLMRFENNEAVDKFMTKDADSMDRFYPLSGDEIAILSYGVDGDDLCVVNVESRKQTEVKDLPFSMTRAYAVCPGTTTDFVVSGDNGICTYSVGDATYKKLMNFPAIDRPLTYLENIRVLENNDIIGSFYDYENESVVLGLFSPYDFSSDARKKLTVACVGLSDDTAKMITEYNKTDKECRIAVLDYSRMGIVADYTLGTETIMKDINEGRIPDVMIVNSNIPFKAYMSKGFFADQKPFIESDSEINLDNYAPNVIKACSMNDKLYMFTPDFGINTVLAKSYYMGNKMGNKLSTFLSTARYSGADIYGNWIQTSLMYNIFESVGEDYIDWNNFTCSFDNTDFQKLISYVSTYPSDYSYNDSSQDEDHGWPYNDYALAYRNDKALCEIRGIYDINSYIEGYRGVFGEPVTMVGFPTESEMGSSISFNYAYSICEASENKDAAWRFVRMFYNEDIGDDIYLNLPTAKKALEAAVKDAGGKYKNYYSEDSFTWENPTYLVGEEYVELTPLDRDESEALLNSIYMIDRMGCENTALMSIIDEETTGYFMGAYDATTTAKSIQEKVTEYLDGLKN